MKSKIILVLLSVVLTITLTAQTKYESDIIKTSKGDLQMTFIGHGTLMFEINKYVIHIDPVSMYADYEKMPKADLILVTHHHSDHFDIKVLNGIKKETAKIIFTKACSDMYPAGIVMNNGESKSIDDFKIEAVPAYNIVNTRSDGNPYHPKGFGNGYILTVGDKRIYIGGDTENFPEMNKIKNIDVAFLPMNLPYTMTPQMVAEAAKVIKPKILYPYHFGDTDTKELVDLMKDEKYCEVRIRNLK
ncbi:MAG: MBL fold metallo-hydrolase [Melioribacteraceae bacterium]|nr:MBL fold metallo-hydrolase [Melioribacteraceae bacterium]